MNDRSKIFRKAARLIFDGEIITGSIARCKVATHRKRLNALSWFWRLYPESREEPFYINREHPIIAMLMAAHAYDTLRDER